MRLERMEFNGVTCFGAPQTINLSDYGPGLVAFVGPNGAGKTSAMEVAPLSLFKRFPTRPGALYDHCSGKGWAETVWTADDGRKITVRLTFDADRRKTEGYVLVDDQPHSDGKAASFDQSIRDLFGSSSLFLASVFAAQDKSGNFLAMKRGDRKALFAELLLLGYLEELAARSRSNRDLSVGRMDAKRDTLAEVEAAAGYVPDLETRAEEMSREIDEAAGTLEAVRLDETAAEEQLRRARSAAERIDELSRASAAAREAMIEAERAAATAEQGPGIVERRAKQMLDTLRARDFGAEIERCNQMKAADVDRLTKRIESVEAQIDEAGDAGQIKAAIDQTRFAIGEREQAAQARLAKVAEHRDAMAEVSRLERTASLRRTVPCDDTLGATCPLLADANRAAGNIDDAQARVVALRRDLDADDADARAEELTGLQAQLSGFGADLEKVLRVPELRKERASLVDERTDVSLRYDGTRQALEQEQIKADLRIREIERNLEAELAKAREVAAEAGAAAARARARSDEAAKALAAVEDVDVHACKIRVDELAAARERAGRRYNDLYAERAAVSARLEAAQKAASRAEEIRAELDGVAVDASDWSRLAEGLGKTGVQALEIDAAGPEIAGLANELLAACYGPRFSIQFDTLRLNQDGSQREVFDVTVYDGAHPRRVEALSGGERVIVGEAVSLALAIYNARKNRVRYRTLWRDETAGALDPENAEHYVEMLRRAREVGGFHQILFVAHLPAVYEAADARIEIGAEVTA